MIIKYLIGIIGISTMMMAWLLIQNLWRKTFADHVQDEDVLVGRADCGSCGCGSSCSIKNSLNNN